MDDVTCRNIPDVKVGNVYLVNGELAIKIVEEYIGADGPLFVGDNRKIYHSDGRLVGAAKEDISQDLGDLPWVSDTSFTSVGNGCWLLKCHRITEEGDSLVISALLRNIPPSIVSIAPVATARIVPDTVHIPTNTLIIPISGHEVKDSTDLHQLVMFSYTKGLCKAEVLSLVAVLDSPQKGYTYQRSKSHDKCYLVVHQDISKESDD